MTTMYSVQGFRSKGRKLDPDLPQPAKSPEAAIAAAERMGPKRAGVWAYSANINQETDTYDEPQVLFRTGTLPPGVGDRSPSAPGVFPYSGHQEDETMSYEQTKRILVLEDEPQTGALIENCLTDAGYIVHLAEAVPRALYLIDDLPFDAAILNYSTGTNTAIQVAESLRVRLIPFVFCTADDDPPAAFEDVPVVGKPFTPDELIGVIRSVFGPPRLSRRAVA